MAHKLIGTLLIIAGLLFLFGAFDYWRIKNEPPIYMRPSYYRAMLEECEYNFDSRCRMYALPEAAAAPIFDAIAPYRREQ